MPAPSPSAVPDSVSTSLSNTGSAPFDAAASQAHALLALINAAWTTQVIHAACVHRLADHIAGGAADAATLSAASGCDADALARLLHAMATIGLCEHEAAVDGDGHGDTTPRCWRLTSMGQNLRIDDPGSLRHWALHAGGAMWQRQGELAEAVRTGRSWAQRRGASHTYEQMLADTAAATVFHRAMVDLTRQAIPQIVPLLEVGGARVVVDVGGGRGELLAAVLAQDPLAHGVLFDQPSALDGAHAVLDRAGVAERCRLEGGDFFAAVPAGGDLYLMKSVLHNWDDRHCTHRDGSRVVTRHRGAAAGPRAQALEIRPFGSGTSFALTTTRSLSRWRWATRQRPRRAVRHRGTRSVGRRVIRDFGGPALDRPHAGPADRLDVLRRGEA
jgi:O-methyltransferase domain